MSRKGRAAAAWAALFGFILGAAPAWAGVDVPRLDGVEVSQPLPLPFDTTRQGMAQIDAALTRAKRSGKPVLVELGGNWCPDCRVLGAVLALPQVQPFIADRFETAAIDVGRFDRNMDVPARFGIAKLAGVPSVLILTPQGKLLNGGEITALGDARTMAPQAIVNWLASWSDRAQGAAKGHH